MAVMRPSHAGAQLIDDFGNRIEAVNFRVGSKKLPTRMFAALYADVDDDKRLGQQALGHHPLGERRIGVMIEVHMPAVLQGFRLGAAVCVWRRRAGKLASKATAAVVRKARGSRWRVRERAEEYGRIRRTRPRKRGACCSKTRPTRTSSPRHGVGGEIARQPRIASI